MNIVDYILRRVLGQVINRGVDAGIRRMSGEKGAISGEARAQGMEARQAARGAKQAAKLTRRLR